MPEIDFIASGGSSYIKNDTFHDTDGCFFSLTTTSLLSDNFLMKSLVPIAEKNKKWNFGVIAQ